MVIGPGAHRKMLKGLIVCCLHECYKCWVCGVMVAHCLQLPYCTLIVDTPERRTVSNWSHPLERKVSHTLPSDFPQQVWYWDGIYFIMWLQENILMCFDGRIFVCHWRVDQHVVMKPAWGQHLVTWAVICHSQGVRAESEQLHVINIIRHE